MDCVYLYLKAKTFAGTGTMITILLHAEIVSNRHYVVPIAGRMFNPKARI
jgi:hypothetical protein